jgi:hypothetical protein
MTRIFWSIFLNVNRPNYIPPIMNLRFLIKETKRDFFIRNTPVIGIKKEEKYIKFEDSGIVEPENKHLA